MKKNLKTTIFIIFLFILIGLSGCKKAQELILYNILGTWNYSQSYSGGTYDTGTITFSGTKSSGTFSLVNFYNITYTGNYTVNDNNITTTGSIEWNGKLTSDNNMSGTWNYNGETATWEANRSN